MIFPGGTGGWEEEEASAGFTFFTGLTPAVAGKGGGGIWEHQTHYCCIVLLLLSIVSVLS